MKDTTGKQHAHVVKDDHNFVVTFLFCSDRDSTQTSTPYIKHYQPALQVFNVMLVHFNQLLKFILQAYTLEPMIIGNPSQSHTVDGGVNIEVETPRVEYKKNNIRNVIVWYEDSKL